VRIRKHFLDGLVRWSVNDKLLPPDFSLSKLLQMKASSMEDHLTRIGSEELILSDPIKLAPIDDLQEVWASGVTYLRSRDARKAESSVADVYEKVYQAERPELFMKSIGWRVVTNGESVRIREDSAWNVPEPELTLIVNTRGEIVGYTAGNDMSSRDIEGANPLYLPQAKVYNRSCAIGDQIIICNVDAMRRLSVQIQIVRAGVTVFEGQTNISQMKRSLEELVAYLYRELDFPHGAFLMTGTGVVPPESFSLQHGDIVKIVVGEIFLENRIE
jgi:2-dehydro-3-deoxy-D-arabinonate dehydratase